MIFYHAIFNSKILYSEYKKARSWLTNQLYNNQAKKVNLCGCNAIFQLSNLIYNQTTLKLPLGYYNVYVMETCIFVRDGTIPDH